MTTDSFAVRAAYCGITPDDLWFTFKVIDTETSIATRIENFMNRLVNPGLGWAVGSEQMADTMKNYEEDDARPPTAIHPHVDGALVGPLPCTSKGWSGNQCRSTLLTPIYHIE